MQKTQCSTQLYLFLFYFVDLDGLWFVYTIRRTDE
jgi:hypothetical protein